MPITALPPAPSRNSPTTFADVGDAFLSALPRFATEANTLRDTVVAAEANCIAAAAAAGATVWVSGTTYAAGDARYSPLDYQTYRRKSTGAGTTDPSIDSTNWTRINLAAHSVPRSARTSNTVLAESDRGNLIDITSGTFTQTFTAAATLTAGWYCWLRNSGSGVVTLDPNASELIDGANTLAVTANQTLLVQCDGAGFYSVVIDGAVGDHAVWVHSGNGHGSTNTKIRRFTTTQSSVGTAITYADSAANGASFTINTPGVYAITYADGYTVSAQNFGVSLNSAELTTNVAAITAGSRLGMTTNSVANLSVALTAVARLTTGDVIRAHDGGSNNFTGAGESYFQIRKIAS